MSAALDVQDYEPAQDYDEPHGTSDEALDTTPHSMEAEQALLGAILYDNAVYKRVSRFLRADHFYNPLHQSFYEAIADLITKGREADAIVLKSRFQNDEALSAVGGVDYLALLLEQAPPTQTAGEYAKIITDASMRRRGQVLLSDLGTSLSDMNGDPAKQIIGQSLEAFRALSRQGVGATNTVTPTEAMGEHLSRERLPSLSTGMPSLDRVCRLDRSALTILAGKTSMGKSAVAVEMARRSAARGEKVYFLSLEMDAGQIAARMVSTQMASVTDTRQGAATVGFPYVNIIRNHELNGDAIGIIRKEMARLPEMRIDAKQSRLTTSDIIARASEGDPPDLLVIDYLSKFDYSDCANNLRHDQKIGLAVNRLRDFAKDTGCAVLLLVQLKRNGADEDTGVPSLEDLRDSGEIEQAADSVFFVHRPAYRFERKAHRLKANGESLSVEDAQALDNCRRDFAIVVAKQRMGGIGTAHMRADVAHNFFYEAPTR